MARAFNLALDTDTTAFEHALRSLTEIHERSPELVDEFISGLGSLSELFRVDSIPSAAGGANELRILFQPSDRLVQFLAATSAGDGNGL